MKRRLRSAGPSEAFYTRSILASRTTVHITWRLAYRATSMLELNGRATAGAGLWHWILPLFVLSDIGQWLVLRRSDRPGLWWRIPLDAADIAFWSLSPISPGGMYDGALFIGIPLVAESGVRYGSAALLVPLAELAVTGIVRALAGKPVLPFTFLWLVLGVAVGWALNAYCRRLYEEAERERVQRREAERRRAFLAGQNAVAMGASSMVDAIEGVVPVLGRPAKGSALWTLAAGWKAELGKTTRSAVVYLRDALGEWERSYNQHPDLSSRAELNLLEGDGTVMLSGPQAAWLHRWLDRHEPHGRLGVALVGDAGRRPRPGAAVRIRVGESVVEVPPDREAVLRPVDPGPVTFFFALGQTLSVGTPSGIAIPLAVVIGLLGLCLGFGVWAHRRLLAWGRAARPSIVKAAVLLALVHTAIGSLTARNGLLSNGNSGYDAVGWIFLGYLGGVYWYRLPRRLVAVLVGGVVGCGALMLLLSPGPHYLRSFLSAAIANLVTFPTCRRISIVLSKTSEAYASQARQQDRAAVDEAFRNGQDTVLDLVRQARDDACRQLAQVGTTLEPRLAALVAQRLEEVDRRLERMDGDYALSSSTTTN